jgi:purine nucleosidase
MRNIWLDTDIGSDIDDALALAYLLSHPAANLVGYPP